MKYDEKFAELYDMDSPAERAKFIKEMTDSIKEDESKLAAAETLVEEIKTDYDKLDTEYKSLRTEFKNQYMLQSSTGVTIDPVEKLKEDLTSELTLEEISSLFN